ncbi:pyridoxal-dependent decarboxylase [Saccharothrix sp. NPDC042600]|uniref:pyridoxal-dependent decarboxylase n=1 Tax=Saccharothrix TaxID=2071 RepID=UPI0033DF7FB3
MGDPLMGRQDAAAALRLVAEAAGPYLDALPTLPVRDAAHAHLLRDLDGPLPEDGEGAPAAVAELLRIGTRAATHSSGPRFFHFVVGGSTPAAQAGDWVTARLDQVGGLWPASPLAARAETVVLRWLRELVGLPETFGGVLTPSATFANLTGPVAHDRGGRGPAGVGGPRDRRPAGRSVASRTCATRSPMCPACWSATPPASATAR